MSGITSRLNLRPSNITEVFTCQWCQERSRQKTRKFDAHKRHVRSCHPERVRSQEFQCLLSWNRQR